MAIESATYISELNASNPAAGDTFGGQAAAHLRLIKSVLLNTFPNISGPVTASHTELNYLDGVTSGVQSQLNSKLSALTISVKTAGFNAAAGYLYVCRSLSATTTCVIPSSPSVGDMFAVVNATSGLGSKNVLVAGSGGTNFLRNGANGTVAVSAGNSAFLVYVDTTTGWAKYET